MKKPLKWLWLAALLIPLVAWANYKKQYCGGQSYLGNREEKYPHLHCGKGFFTLSTGGKHTNMNEGQGKDGAGCKRARAILQDPPYNSENTERPDDITNAIQKFIDAECQ